MSQHPFLTNSEDLHGKVTTDRLKELIGQADQVCAHLDTNSYGEFVFVNLLFGAGAYFAYGAGYHEVADRYMHGSWCIQSIGHNYPSFIRTPMEPAAVRQVVDREEARSRDLASRHPVSEEARLFAEVAEMMGEDEAAEFLAGEM